MLLLCETDIILQLQIAVIQVAHFDILSLNISLLGCLAYVFRQKHVLDNRHHYVACMVFSCY